MNIYFSGSIRGGRNDVDKYSFIIKELGKFGVVLTAHIGNKSLNATGEDLDEKDIYDRDMAWLKAADVLVAEISQPATGVGYEIAIAEILNKNILCLYQQGSEKLASSMVVGSGKNGNLVFKTYKKLEEIPQVLDEFFINSGARGRTRTDMGYPTRF